MVISHRVIASRFEGMQPQDSVDLSGEVDYGRMPKNSRIFAYNVES